MASSKCLICGKEFYIRPNHLNRGWGKYCSADCRTKSQFKGKLVTCFICNKETYRTPKELKTSRSGNYFCSRSCQTIWRNKFLFSGENHANWKTGRAVYRRILLSSGREKICILCKTEDARILAVHHIDKNRLNNKLENLTWLCHNCHYLVHHFAEAKYELTKILNLVAVVQK